MTLLVGTGLARPPGSAYLRSLPGSVDAERMKAAAAEPGNWLATGRDQEGTYYSPLTRINSKNVGKLGFACQYELGTYRRQEATPTVVAGVMFTSRTCV